jgi:hypothetical protein
VRGSRPVSCHLTKKVTGRAEFGRRYGSYYHYYYYYCAGTTAIRPVTDSTTTYEQYTNNDIQKYIEKEERNSIQFLIIYLLTEHP